MTGSDEGHHSDEGDNALDLPTEEMRNDTKRERAGTFVKNLWGEAHKMRHPAWWAAALKFAVPIFAIAAYLLSIMVFYPHHYGRIYGFMATFALTPVGKFTASGLAVFLDGVKPLGVLFVPPFIQSTLLLGTIDLLVGFFLVYNYDLLHKVPGLGRPLMKIEEQGRKQLLNHSWMRQVALIGVAILVAVPFYGTGSIAGAVVARVIGMKRWRAFLGIAIGSYLGVGVLAFSGAGIASAFKENLLLGIVVVLAAILLLFGGWLLWKRIGRRGRASENGEE